ncbi:MAG TPA: His-Xaa-Ser system radical SAM maturase HxsB [Ruminococcus sp.]|nr:His-Xaa-Ser system radical SAM maturase HxsB [Ruminococcus sp.]
MKNYFNFSLRDNNKILLTNDFGYYCYLNRQEFKDFINDNISINTEKGQELVRKKFIFSDTEIFIENNFLKLKNMKSYLFRSPTLHIFVVTTQCNADCVYCQAHSEKTSHFMNMDICTAEKAVDIALKSPQNYLSFEFQGGEPLINYPVIKHIIEYTESTKNDKIIEYSLVSNLTLLTDEMINFLKNYNVSFSVSLDGSKDLHDMNRPLKSGESMYNSSVKNLMRLRNTEFSVGAIQTTTRYSLDKFLEITDKYIELGFHDIFIRPLTPLGMAHDNWKRIGYTPEEFLIFYKKCLSYIISVNKNGYRLTEGHARIFLHKILNQNAVNYMELRSPCGGGTGQIAYYPNGDVYTCDEARMLADMGDKSFRMGDVFSCSYETLINSTACKVVCKSSVLETIPSCCDCVYQPYCGVCPVINYAFNNSVYEKFPHSYRCKIYKGMLDCLFDFLENQEVKHIFENWLN